MIVNQTIYSTYKIVLSCYGQLLMRDPIRVLIPSIGFTDPDQRDDDSLCDD